MAYPHYTSASLKPKDLVGIPWRVAFALQADGWYLRQDLIWAKPNPMPESVRDRCTKSHEYIFLLSKTERYYYDADAIAEDMICDDPREIQSGLVCGRLYDYDTKEKELRASWHGSNFKTGKTGEMMQTRGGKVPRKHDGTNSGSDGTGFQTHNGNSLNRPDGKRNKRSVWTVTTKPFKGAHFATFPPGLIEPCILAGSKPGDLVLDPFGVELNPEYEKLSRERTAQQGLALPAYGPNNAQPTS